MTSLRHLSDLPDLRDPVLVVMLDGWIDAAGAARAAIDAIEHETQMTPFVQFDDDTFVDYRARRPTMVLRNGLHDVLEWQHLTMASGTDQTGRDFLLLTGPEPDMRWHEFTDLVGDLTTQLGVSFLAHLGAYPFATPHTRPPRLSVSSPSVDVLASVPFLRSSVDVPAGAAASLEADMHRRGIPAIGIWVQVPHYITQVAYPAASVALLDGLHEATGLVFDIPELRAYVLQVRERIDQMIAENPEHLHMIEQLEKIYEATDTDVDVTDHGPSIEFRTGDELAAELEEFLRDQE